MHIYDGYKAVFLYYSIIIIIHACMHAFHIYASQ